MQLYTWYCKIRGFWCFPKVAWKRMVEASPFLHTLLGNLTPICRELCWELCQIHPDAETQTETSRNTLMCKKNKSKTGGIQNDPTLSQHEPLTHQPSLPGPPHLPFQACRASRKWAMELWENWENESSLTCGQVLTAWIPWFPWVCQPHILLTLPRSWRLEGKIQTCPLGLPLACHSLAIRKGTMFVPISYGPWAAPESLPLGQFNSLLQVRLWSEKVHWQLQGISKYFKYQAIRKAKQVGGALPSISLPFFT